MLFRIMHDVVATDALGPAAGVAFMLDQCQAGAVTVLSSLAVRRGIRGPAG
jgi:hypothetical protein